MTKTQIGLMLLIICLLLTSMIKTLSYEIETAVLYAVLAFYNLGLLANYTELKEG